MSDFNPRSPRGGATLCAKIEATQAVISIHAPHEGERLSSSVGSFFFFLISIHAPHEGERQSQAHTPPCGLYNFNPRSPRGGATRIGQEVCPKFDNFNPRSPRGGATCCLQCIHLKMITFQSTLPTRGSDRSKEIIDL